MNDYYVCNTYVVKEIQRLCLSVLSGKNKEIAKTRFFLIKSRIFKALKAIQDLILTIHQKF